MKRLLSVIFLIFIVFFNSFLFLNAYAQVENSIILDRAKSTDLASKKLWKYILRETRLSEENAKLFNIHEEDCKAVFFDLNDDGVDEIIGTHKATGLRHLGYNIMYILNKDKKGKYRDIGYNMFFEQNSPIYILKTKNNGFHDLKCYNKDSDDNSIFIFSKSIEKYVDKSLQKNLEKEYKNIFY